MPVRYVLCFGSCFSPMVLCNDNNGEQLFLKKKKESLQFYLTCTMCQTTKTKVIVPLMTFCWLSADVARRNNVHKSMDWSGFIFEQLNTYDYSERSRFTLFFKAINNRPGKWHDFFEYFKWKMHLSVMICW